MGNHSEADRFRAEIFGRGSTADAATVFAAGVFGNSHLVGNIGKDSGEEHVQGEFLTLYRRGRILDFSARLSESRPFAQPA